MEELLNIDVKKLIRNSVGSFGDIYCKFSILQNRLTEYEEFSEKEKKKLADDYAIFRNDVARRVESCRQSLYSSYKYDKWYNEIKAFYESLPKQLFFSCN